MNLKKRLLSSCILWTTLGLLLLFFKLPGMLGIVLFFIISSEIELARLLRLEKKQQYFDIGLASVFIVAYYFMAQQYPETLDFLYAMVLIALCTWTILVGKNIQCFLNAFFCFWYLPFNFHFLFKIANQFQWNTPISLGVLIWITCVTKLTDVGGYFIGCSFGKHSLASTISPKKTWEGGLGGIVFAICGGWILYCLFPNCLPPSFTQGHGIIFAFILALGSIFSDLFESLLKRQWQVKDSGKVIPGIGGILDLIDSLLLNFPLAFILFKHFV